MKLGVCRACAPSMDLADSGPARAQKWPKMQKIETSRSRGGHFGRKSGSPALAGGCACTPNGPPSGPPPPSGLRGGSGLWGFTVHMAICGRAGLGLLGPDGGRKRPKTGPTDVGFAHRGVPFSLCNAQRQRSASLCFFFCPAFLCFWSGLPDSGPPRPKKNGSPHLRQNEQKGKQYPNPERDGLA